ncbi:hypothetical protein KEH51_08640 [[Brevibacterium] frigoritolerans]|uniref:Major facilitator superfamily (MFS) profile domain-containing protein n=1 Tax=Peribacillus frigoritolerans TaxID=450367 RepID=A0A941FHY2_9BACI|nr:hypothetical protein [Peribacillus frigoritolerans]
MWMSILSGYLLKAFDWRWLFIIEGLPAVLWAFIWYKVVNDRPKDAKWLTDQEKQDMGSDPPERTGCIKTCEKL